MVWELLLELLRLFNPFVGCHLCSAIAIMAEGAIFEIIWYKISFDLKELKKYYYASQHGDYIQHILFMLVDIL